MPLNVATDGSFSPVTGTGAWAWVDDCGHARTGIVPTRLRPCPLSAELCALDDALAALPRGTPATISIDSKDVLRVIRDPRRAAGSHRPLVRRITDTLHGRQPGERVTLRYVRGHSGDRLNTAADELCVAARHAHDTMSAESLEVLRGLCERAAWDAAA